MDAVDLIERKKRGQELEPAAIAALIAAYVAGEVPDYQMAAWLMAVRWRGLSAGETQALVAAYLADGARVRFSPDAAPVVDKHSTGGVGDTTSLIVAPLAAACGLRVAKMSGRGLGITAGSIDKLEAIPGFSVDLGPREFAAQVNATGLAIAAHSPSLVPADARIYALRDVTATVDSIPLIAASIVSKKLALETDAVIFDVKMGCGTFMRTRDQARRLAQSMLALMAAAGRRARALITRMDEPLGLAVGHSLEVSAALEVLRGGGDQTLRNLALTLVCELLDLAGAAAPRTPEEALRDGAAYDRFAAMVRAQGGDLAAFERDPHHQRVPVRRELRASRHGFVQTVDAEAVGQALRELGGGRRVKDADIDRAVGILLAVRSGSEVRRGDLLATVYAREPHSAERASELVEGAIAIGSDPHSPPAIVLERLSAPNVG